MIKEGITHIEDLPIDEFIEAVRNLNAYKVSEKIDGFNLKFGIDEDGFFVKGKGNNKYRRFSDWPDQFRYTGFKSAHKALANVLPDLLKSNLLKTGDLIEAEVLFGERPNTVPYNDTNKIIFLRTISGDTNIKTLRNMLSDKQVPVTIEAHKTNDGINLFKERERHIWTFEENPRKSLKVADTVELQKIDSILSQLERYLESDSEVNGLSNAEVLALPMNKKPGFVEPNEWKNIKQTIKDKKREIVDTVYNHKLDIKENLLNQLVRNVQSHFGPEIEEGGWIEGIVLSRDNGKEEQLIKIVDKDVFTSLNKFYWDVRNKLTGNAKGLKDIRSIISKLKVSMAAAVGHPDLATNQKRSYLKRNGLTLDGLANDIDYKETKKQFERALNKAEGVLAKYHNVYNKMKSQSFKDISFGDMKKRFHIDKSVDEVNLLSFAELYDMIENFKEQVEDAKSSKDLIKIIVGDDLKESINAPLKNLVEWIEKYEIK